MKTKKAALTKEEREILRSVDRGEWKPIKNFKDRVKELQAAARATLRKNKRISLRVTDMDLKNVKRLAFEEGIPYQTLIASILHKYIAGRLSDKDLKRSSVSRKHAA